MSSRALRKAQRELEEKKQQELLQKEQEDEEDEDEDEPPVASSKAKPSAFALLGAEEAEEDEDEDEREEPPKSAPVEEEQGTGPETPEAAPSKSSKNKKKKKKKGKGSGAKDQSQDVSTEQLDEIDLALRSLSTTDRGQAKTGDKDAKQPENTELFSLLSVDTTYLHAANEMRRLFGRAAVEGDRDDNDDGAGGGGRRRGRGQQQAGLAGALAGRNQPGGGRNLASLGLRRNIFIQGKEEWPRATLGGLGMEIVEKRPDGSVEYRFIHNSAYQDVQRQFTSCVGSMDPNRLVQLLQFNPYHISTLLQVSEIAKHERDHATSGDLLERALFSLGRAVHSSFATNLQAGKARLDFRRPENREFWLAAWRYIDNLGMRSTWRTAFEWARLLLSLDPDWDPYCICLVIDQLALRARQPQRLIDLYSSSHFNRKWSRLPNITHSIGLAYTQISIPDMGHSILRSSISTHPWVTESLFKTLDIQPLPPTIWGKTAPTPVSALFTILYSTRAKDLWNTPEATSLLMSCAHKANPSPQPISICDDVVSELDYTRHVLLADQPHLTALLSHRLTSNLNSVGDPLPPQENLPSYDPSPISRPGQSNSASGGRRQTPAEMLGELTTLQQFFRTLLPWFGEGQQGGLNPETGQQPTEEDLEARIRESGVSPQEVVARTQRLAELQRRIQAEVGGGEDDMDEDEALARRLAEEENEANQR